MFFLDIEWKGKLLQRLSIDNDEQIFDRLDELQRTNQLDQTGFLSPRVFCSTPLVILVSEQQSKIAEYEDTIEKLRSQRERMLTKMKDIKTNNESLISQVNRSSFSCILIEFNSAQRISTNHR